MEKELKPENSGRVPDPKLAQEMAGVEAPYHKKTLGVFSPSSKKIARGEQAVEQYRLKGIEITESELPTEVLKIVENIKKNIERHVKEELGELAALEGLIH